MLKISVIVCTYNRAEILRGCLDSLVQQNVEKAAFEVIVLDNNSTDDTEEVVKFFLNQYPNVSYIKELSQGLSHARNRGFREAKGEFVAYIDDDARANENYISIIQQSISSGFVVFGGPCTVFFLNEKPKWFKDEYGIVMKGSTQRILDKDEYLDGFNMIFQKKLLESVGGFSPKIGMSGHKIAYGEETRLQILLRQKGVKIHYIPDLVVEHLIPEHKQTVSWFFKASYACGRDSWHTFMDTEKISFLTLLPATVYLTLKSTIKFLLMLVSGQHYKASLVDSFREPVYSLGKLMNMRRG